MIRIAVHPDRSRAATEFFELFKTDWTHHHAGESCKIVLTDGTVPADLPATLCMVFTPVRQTGDLQAAEVPGSSGAGRMVRFVDGTELAVYTDCTWFHCAEEPLMTDQAGRVLAYKQTENGRILIRVGYDLFDEVSYLLSNGQPPDNAALPSLDRQIDFVRRCILDAGLPVIEIPPCPPGHPYMVCLTHDVDFVSIRQYGFGRTFWGFARRALIGSLKQIRKKNLTVRGLLKNYAAVFSVPLIHLGLLKDFWMQFDAYRRIEEPHRSTFFLIPFKGQAGENVSGSRPELRAARYDVEDVRKEAMALLENGWEVGLHGIDAWNSDVHARREKERMNSVLNRNISGVRMHWLCRNDQTEKRLDDAGFEFDSTFGYNETVGFRAGTSQVFMPLQARRLLEIPLHIQDVALFYPAFLDLDDRSAWKRCATVFEHQKAAGGVLTVLWHMRSLAPERLWGGFYQRLLKHLEQDQAWFGTAGDVASWFRKRRQTRLSVSLAPDGEWIVHLQGDPGSKMAVRIYHPVHFADGTPPSFSDLVWSGQPGLQTGFYENPQGRAPNAKGRA